MSEQEPVKEPAAERPAGRSMAFRKRRNATKLAPDQLRRQSSLVESAWRHFREAAPMIAFLNTHHEALDGPPLHVAVESDEGFERVERLLQQLTREA
jgi:hypothetical protein